MRIRGLWKLPDERDWLWVKLGLALVGKAILSKFLIHFSADGCACIPSLWIGLRPAHKGSQDCRCQCTYPCSRPLLIHTSQETPGKSQVWLSLLWGHCSFLLGPDVPKVLLCPQRVCFPSPVEVL